VRTHLSSLVILSAAAVVAACSDGTSPEPDDDATLEEVLSELSTVGTYAGAGVAPSGVGMVGVSAPPPEVCPFDATTEYFICAERTHEGVTMNRRYQLFDAGGSPLPAFDGATVFGIRSIADVSGTRQLPGLNGSTLTLTIDAHDDQILTGLGTATRTVNGTGTSEITTTHDGQTRTTNSTRTTENLVLPSGPGAYPASGTITNTGTSEGMTFSSTMTFNGSSTVTIVFSFNGTTQTCTYDLANRMSPPVCQ
jgi:hypothetical protein